MKSKDTKSPLAKARDKWMRSKEGRDCLDNGILFSPNHGPYLKNRLERAFIAGATWAESNKEKE
jgi:hypothetical protein